MKQQWTVEYRNWIGADKYGLGFLRARKGRGKWLKAAEVPPHVAQYLHLDRVGRQWYLSGITEQKLIDGGQVTFARKRGRVHCRINAPAKVAQPKSYSPHSVSRFLPNYDSPWQLYRAKYKYTDCGPSLGMMVEGMKTLYCDSLPGSWGAVVGRITGFTVGSIVEGVDIECQDIEVPCYPLRTLADRIDAAVDEVNGEAEYIWNQTHGCPRCKRIGEWGHDAINPKCRACKGQGVIL